MADNKRQHRVPILLLKGWEGPMPHRDRQLGVTSLLDKKTKYQSSRETAVDIYTFASYPDGPEQPPDVGIEKFLGRQVENPAEPILTSWRAGGQVKPEQIPIMARFLATQSLRGGSIPERMRLTCEEYGYHMSIEEVRSASGFYLMTYGPDFERAFATRYDWLLLDFDDFIITSDEPLCYFPDQISNAETADRVFMPLGRKLGLVLVKKAGPGYLLRREAAQEAVRQDCIQTVLDHANKIIIHHPDDRLPTDCLPSPLDHASFHAIQPLKLSPEGVELLKQWIHARRQASETPGDLPT